MSKAISTKSSDHSTGGLDVISDDLARVEERIRDVISSRETTLTTISDYLINAGGKRVRPAVSLLVFRACGGHDPTDVIDLSVSLELIHSATLLHDDIIDSNDTRRGRDAAPVRFGVANTLVTGDFLFSRAFEVCGRFEPTIVSWAAEACIQLTEGEVMQGRFRRNPAATVEDYDEIIERKTASLFAAGARIAAHLADVPTAEVEQLRQCGRHIGFAFQMIDDVLDIEGDPRRTGKQVGTDLLDGNPSLPIIWGLDLPAVREAFSNEDTEPRVISDAVGQLVEAGIAGRVRERAIGHARAAYDIIKTLDDTPYSQVLAGLVEDLVDRDL